jgi:hypothetical protein
MNHITLGIHGFSLQASILEDLSDDLYEPYVPSPNKEDVVEDKYYEGLLSEIFDVHDIAQQRLRVCTKQGHAEMLVYWNTLVSRCEHMLKEFAESLNFFFPDIGTPRHVEWN